MYSTNNLFTFLTSFMLLLCSSVSMQKAQAQCQTQITSITPTGIACPNETFTFTGTGQGIATSFDFNGATFPTGWIASAFTLGQPCNTPSSDGTNYFWSAAGNVSRFVQTNAIDVSAGGNLIFVIDFGDDDPEPGCENVDANEGVFLQYSINGGTSWVDIQYFDPADPSGGAIGYNWTPQNIVIPSLAQTASTAFRWIQPNHSGTGFDNWGLDNISVTQVLPVTAHSWDFGDGSPLNTSSGTVTHAYTGTGVYTVTYQGTILGGCTNSTTTTVTVANPTITAPANLVVPTTSGCTVALSSINLGTPTTTSACTIVSSTNDAPDPLTIGATVITWTSTFSNGYVTTATQTVTVFDAPILIPLPNVSRNADLGFCTFKNAALSIPNGTATTCSSAIASYSYTLSGATVTTPVASLLNLVFNSGVTTVTWTATNTNGNTSASSSFTVTVVDTQIPTITPPANITVAATAGTCGAVVNYAANSTFYKQLGNSFENGRVSNTLYPLIQADDFTIPATTTWSITNLKIPFFTNNPTNATAIKVYFYDDNTGRPGTLAHTINLTPTNWTSTVIGSNFGFNINEFNLTFPSPLILTTGASSKKYWLAVQVQNSISGNDFYWELSTNHAATYGNNAHQSSSFSGVFTQVEIESFVFSIEGAGGLLATDNCAVSSVTQTAGLASGSTFPVGTTTNTFTATDASGNVSAPTSFTVTVNDTQLPVLTALSNVSRDADNGFCTFTNIAGALNIPNGTATDNCSVASYEYILTGATTGTVSTLTTQAFNVGVTTVTWTAKDASNNISTTSSFTVTVVDTQLPVLTALSNVSRNVDAGFCTFTNTAGALNIPNGTAVDNCSVASYEYILTGATTGTVSTLATQTFNGGVTTVTWTATDANGNISATSSFTVTVNSIREIDVLGNSVSIADGDITPDTADKTDFGNVGLTRTVTYTLSNAGTDVITITSITSDNANFAIANAPTTVAAGGTATFEVIFTPTISASQTAIITINNNDCDESVYDFVVKGRKASPAPVVIPTPSAPIGFTATAVSPTQINLAWTLGTQNATEYQIFQYGVLIATLPIGTTTYQVTGLTPNTLYSFDLVAVNRVNGQVKTNSSNAKEWTFPGIPYLISIAEVCTTGNANVKVGSSLGSVYRVYDKLTGGTLLLESINGSFELPYTNQDTVFYISVLGSGRVRGTGLGYESERLPVSVRVADAFESVILGENVQTSCGNSLTLQAKEVEGANFYQWYLNDQPFTAGQTLTTITSGYYKLLVRKANCYVVSQEVLVKLNQTPIAKIQGQSNIRFCDNGTLKAIEVGVGANYEWSLNNAVIGQDVSISVNQSGTYTLEVTQNGCKASTQVEVVVSPTPAVPVLVASETIICPNTETTISVQNAENGVTYEWFRNGRNIRQTGTSISTSIKGKYQVRASASANFACSVFSTQLQINRFNVEIIYLRVSDDKKSLFVENLAGSQDGIASIEWYFEGELNASLGTTSAITPTENGHYSAMVTNQNGCKIQTRTVYFTVPAVPVITGQEDLKADLFKIYPNPSKGIFNVHFGTVLIENIHVSIFDATGKVIQTQIFEKGNQDFTFDIQKFTKGIYLIRLNQNNTVYSKSIILD